jgi:FkbH-like protein
MTSELKQVFQRLDQRPTVAAYARAARELRDLQGMLQPVRVALLSTFTIDQLTPFLAVEAARQGFATDIYVAPFNSVRQELLDPESGCVRHAADAVFIIQSLHDVCPPLSVDFLGMDEDSRDRHTDTIVADLIGGLRAFRARSAASVIVANFAKPRFPPLGLFEVMAPQSLTATINALNARLATELRDVPGVYVLDFDKICADVGYHNAWDDRMWHLGRAPLSASLLPALARVQSAALYALTGTPRKCLVLDLDNTLWGGVVGEAGLAGIKLGHAYPGNVFREFQCKVLELHRRGTLLAINSKNNREDVDEVFRSHPDMVLKWEHFASVRVNWRDKPENMREIAGELNIGIDSLVFFDDSAVEREIMTRLLPAVLTLDVPSDPADYVKALCEGRAFDRVAFTDEDRRRGEMYRQQVERQTLRAAGSMDEFLSSLGTTVRIRAFEPFAFPRVLDLLHKTNQFNLTTRRHSGPELQQLIDDPESSVFTLQVLDRFGDEGIVGVAIVQRRGRTAYIDSFLLSCRVIGRRVETALLAFIGQWAAHHGLEWLEGEFLPTKKNAPAADFYARHGFAPIDDVRWTLDLRAYRLDWPQYITADLPAAEAATTIKT